MGLLVYTYRRSYMGTQYYGDYIMETILWRPNTVSIIETKLWRPNFGDLILWKLYYCI